MSKIENFVKKFRRSRIFFHFLNRKLQAKICRAIFVNVHNRGNERTGQVTTLQLFRVFINFRKYFNSATQTVKHSFFFKHHFVFYRKSKKRPKCKNVQNQNFPCKILIFFFWTLIFETQLSKTSVLAFRKSFRYLTFHNF